MSLSSLLMQVASNPKKVSEPSSDPFLPATNKLVQQSGFAGVQRSVSDDRYVGSGLQLKLELSSGQSIELNIEKSVGGGVKDISLRTRGELSAEDQDRLTQIFKKISYTLEGMFADKGSPSTQNAFDFANISGVKEIEFTVQQDVGNVKQRLEFEKHHSANGRKEVEAQWSRYNHATGEKEQHDFALSKQPKEVAMAYGQMNYQWVLDQVQAGMGILGNAHSGDTSLQSRVTDFFTSGVQALFAETQSAQHTLQTLGASANEAQQFLGRTIRALTSEQKETSQTLQNMPGLAVEQGQNSANKGGAKQGINSLPDFKADFASSRNSSYNLNDGYNLTMEVSQSSHLVQGATEDDRTQTQFRRLLLKYESQAGSEEYEYNWRHDESLINRYKNGMLEKGYLKIEDLQQGILTNLNGVREETSLYMQRTEYDAKNNQGPALQNQYIKPSTYIERGHNVNHSV